MRGVLESKGDTAKLKYGRGLADAGAMLSSVFEMTKEKGGSGCEGDESAITDYDYALES